MEIKIDPQVLQDMFTEEQNILATRQSKVLLEKEEYGKFLSIRVKKWRLFRNESKRFSKDFSNPSKKRGCAPIKSSEAVQNFNCNTNVMQESVLELKNLQFFSKALKSL
jgi:hypothetical protein